MRRRMLCALLIVMVLVAATAVAETTRYGTMMVDNCEEWVSLRDGPGTGCGRLAKVPLYAIVTDCEKSEWTGDFIYCNYDGQWGYILAQYLTPWADPEPELNARFDSGLGFSFGYDDALLAVDAESSEDGQRLMLCPVDTDLPVCLEIMTAESIGAMSCTFLEVNAPEDVEYEADVTDDGSAMQWFEKAADDSDEIAQIYYAVDGPERSVVAVATYPAGDGAWRAQFRAVMCSIRFGDVAPIRADWAEATKRALVVDPDGEYVTIMADEPLTGVALLALELADVREDGSIAWDASVIHEQGAMAAEDHLVVKIAFPGDMPMYGIRLVDACGETRQFAIAMSGRDGSLILDEF